ncbi:DUF309 domain-containing protein [Anaerobacillus alkalilacustris]|uniref:DUF309 domain-containing protein n=1 Tax=Anaerobacillus alkalilacustris TaxID=393763 RepID=UPI000A042AA6|nr:DUF309 domain-containing protein [Anaerobacillus alkalilacustris]
MYPQPYLEYLIYFHCQRDYFECHEVLEEYWKENEKNNKVWVGFIQLAVSMYHYRRGNFTGAKKQIEKSIKIFEHEKNQLNTLGIDPETFFKLINNQKVAIKNNLPYTPIALPINKSLMEECIKKSKEKGILWGKEEIILTDKIIHKHKLRDRSLIIEERKKQLNRRRKQ